MVILLPRCLTADLMPSRQLLGMKYLKSWQVAILILVYGLPNTTLVAVYIFYDFSTTLPNFGLFIFVEVSCG